MYSGASSAESPLAEEFLLGRRQHKGPETSASGISRPNFPPSHEKAPIHREHGRTQDIEAKIREDPLFTIMQKERSIIDEVNQNPVMSKRSKESRPNTGRPSDARISKIVHKRRK